MDTKGFIKYNNKYRRTKPEFKKTRNNREKNIRILQKWVCIYHYSHGTMKCVCCGESIYQFLCIDHINNDGAKHRREIKILTIYSWLIRNNFPEGFQTYCFNCNLGKRINKGICPHVINT